MVSTGTFALSMLTYNAYIVCTLDKEVSQYYLISILVAYTYLTHQIKYFWVSPQCPLQADSR